MRNSLHIAKVPQELVKSPTFQNDLSQGPLNEVKYKRLRLDNLQNRCIRAKGAIRRTQLKCADVLDNSVRVPIQGIKGLWTNGKANAKNGTRRLGRSPPQKQKPRTPMAGCHTPDACSRAVLVVEYLRCRGRCSGVSKVSWLRIQSGSWGGGVIFTRRMFGSGIVQACL